MPRLDYIERDGLPAEWVVLRRRIHYKPLISMNIPNKPRLSDPKLAAAFTLIELLTVIAIIGILAAILIPVVGKVRSSAKAAMCMSNLRQIGTATFMYLNDHDDRFFPKVGGSRLTSMGKRGTIRTTPVDQRPLNEYLDAKGDDHPVEVAWCPEDDSGYFVVGGGQAVSSSYDASGSSYHANHYGTIGLLNANQQGIHLNEIVEPMRFVMFAEDPAITNAFGETDRNDGWHWEGVPMFHLLFADGHVGKHSVTRNERNTVEYTFYRDPPVIPTRPTR